MPTYFDTSALAKRYLAEPGSEEVDGFLAQHADDCVISPLVSTELESVLQRLQRQALIDRRYAARVRRHFSTDLGASVWAMRPFDPATFQRAQTLLRELGAPLATLDALHLGCAIELHCTAVATADRQLAHAAQVAGLVVHSFVP